MEKRKKTKVPTSPVGMVQIGRLKPHPDNPRLGDVQAIQQSIQQHGMYGALVGNHRLKAALAEGIKLVPVHYVDVDDEAAAQILLRDNRTSDLGSYDEDKLLLMLDQLGEPEMLDGAGYDTAYVDLLRLAAGEGDSDPRERHGPVRDDDFWPTIRLALPPKLLDRFRAALEAQESDQDYKRLEQLLDKADAA